MQLGGLGLKALGARRELLLHFSDVLSFANPPDADGVAAARHLDVGGTVFDDAGALLSGRGRRA